MLNQPPASKALKHAAVHGDIRQHQQQGLLWPPVEPPKSTKSTAPLMLIIAMPIISTKSETWSFDMSHWIGFVGKIYRKPWFLPSNIGLSCKFSHNPILWMIWHDLTWFDMIWHDLTWFDMIWHDLTWFWHDLTWFDMIWHDLTWFDMIWHVQTCPNVSKHVKTCQKHVKITWIHHPKSCSDHGKIGISPSKRVI